MSKHGSDIDRRRLLLGAASAGLLGTIVRPGLTAVASMGAGALRAQPTRAATRLVLLGTQGGPNFNEIRNESASAVVTQDAIYLVDCGYGALGAVRKAGLNFREIGHVFLTHLHDDHTADLAPLLSHQWSDGRVEPTLVLGPYGTQKMVEAALDFAEANTLIRLADEGRSVRPAEIFAGRDVEATAAPHEIYADDRVVVTAVENTHFPASSKERFPYRALSYRFDCRDRSIVFSGDTAYSENLIELARGADVLVCEAIEVESMRRAFERRVADGAYADNAEGIWKHIVETHTSTEDAGRMAAAAGVRLLVLNHLIPGALVDIGDAAYVAGVRQHYAGEVVVGADLMAL